MEIKFQGVIKAVTWRKDILWTNNNSQRCQMMFQGFNIVHVNFEFANISQTCSTVTFFSYSTLLSNTGHQIGLLCLDIDFGEPSLSARRWWWCILLWFSRSVMSVSLWPRGLQPARRLCPWDFRGKSSGVDCHFLFQGIFPNPGIEPSFPAWQANSLPLSHQGSLVMMYTFIKYSLNYFKMQPQNQVRHENVSSEKLRTDIHIANTYHRLLDDLQETNSWQRNEASEGRKSLQASVRLFKADQRGLM